MNFEYKNFNTKKKFLKRERQWEKEKQEREALQAKITNSRFPGTVQELMYEMMIHDSDLRTFNA